MKRPIINFRPTPEFLTILQDFQSKHPKLETQTAAIHELVFSLNAEVKQLRADLAVYRGREKAQPIPPINSEMVECLIWNIPTTKEECLNCQKKRTIPSCPRLRQ